MIKRVIFDIDSTLIPWKEEYNTEIKNVLDNLKISYIDEDLVQLSKAFDEYENQHFTFNKKTMIEFINEFTKKQYPEKVVYDIIDRWSNCVPDKIDSNIEKTLEYLQSKYEMVILTDWYAEPQKKRLEKLDILKYFSKVYSAEKTKRKPFKEAFLQAIGDNKPEECIMIGDNIERDIEGALNAGLKAVYYNPNNKIEKIENAEYYKISNLEELKEIL